MARRAELFLSELSKPGTAPVFAGDVSVVVAHPDDETVGCGAVLARLDGVLVVVVTDGAPRNLVDAKAYGFGTGSAYAAARQRELEEALAIAGVPASALVTLDEPDQQAASRLIEIAMSLADLLQNGQVRLALTHAYEGGHPDHDATAFAVHAAARLLARRGHVLEIIEMPYYRLAGACEVHQRFASLAERPETEVALASEEQERKRRMIAAHKTQSAVLASFAVDAERFRPAPAYDFARLPNDGRLLYERRPWGMTGARWRALSAAALARLT